MAEDFSSFALAPNADKTRIAPMRITVQEIDFLGFIRLPPFVQMDREYIAPFSSIAPKRGGLKSGYGRIVK
jgi:hypothetical protein